MEHIGRIKEGDRLGRRERRENESFQTTRADVTMVVVVDVVVLVVVVVVEPGKEEEIQG